MMDIAIFGSLYLDGVSVPHSPCPEYQKDQKIELGDGQPGAMLPWLCVGKKLIAAESLLCNVSWSQLQKAGFISGCTGTAPIRGSVVKMSGMEFMCHIPNIHKEPSEPIAGMRDARLWESRPNEDETDLLIARAEAGAESRPTKDGMFWTQVIGNPTMRGRDLGWISDQKHAAMFCGYYRPNGYFAWLPVLEPINMPDPAEHVGEDMTFLLPEFVLMGEPVEVSNYDLLVRVDSKENLEKLLSRARGQNEWWNMLGEDMVALDRNKLIHCGIR